MASLLSELEAGVPIPEGPSKLPPATDAAAMDLAVAAHIAAAYPEVVLLGELSDLVRASGVPADRHGYDRTVAIAMRWLLAERWAVMDARGKYRAAHEWDARLEVARSRLPRLREERGWDLEEAAAALGVTVARLHDLESEREAMTLAEVRRAARVFGLPVWRLCPGARSVSAAARWPGRL